MIQNNNYFFKFQQLPINKRAKFYHENVIHRYVLMIIFYLTNAIVYVFCTYYVFSSFLLCCNASAFVIYAIKNYLLTYLLMLYCWCKYFKVFSRVLLLFQLGRFLYMLTPSFQYFHKMCLQTFLNQTVIILLSNLKVWNNRNIKKENSRAADFND